jgi:acylphosphatase
MSMKRTHIIVDGYVQNVGFREYVHKETFDNGISGYVKNLDTGKVEIIAEGREGDLQTLITRINITHYPIAVTECNVTWQKATGEFKKFEIIRRDIQEEIFERIDYAGTIMHETLDISKKTYHLQTKMLDKQDQMLDKQDQMLGKQDQMLDIGRETKDEITGLRTDTGKYLGDEFKDIKKELLAIKDALSRAGIKV